MRVMLFTVSIILISGLQCFVHAQDNNNSEQPVVLSDQTEECIDCHGGIMPGVVEDWRSSRHAKITPESALAKPELERRISSESVSDNLKSVAVGCYECHSLNPDKHKDNFEHFGYKINIVVSPGDCQTCHAVEVEQYSKSKKAHALGNLQENPVYHSLVETITSVKKFKDGELLSYPSDNSKNETCYACHGTEIKVTGTRVIETDFDDIEIPMLSGWPNQGVGRVNPDGTLGACTACHPRHSFSIEIARKPYTCSQCHLDPDVPAWNVYRESKHGNIFQSLQTEWNWNNVPWTVGKDFKAPTCAVCHNSLLTNPSGEIIVARTHDFGERLWIRLFGLIYAHPQPKSGQTYLIKNKDGLPLPTTFSGEFASEYLINTSEQSKRKNMMAKICQTCHSLQWANNHFDKLDSTIAETNRMTLTATQLMQKAWDKKLTDPGNPFDEAIEHLWIKQWLFYANSIRYASAMAGPDYAAFKNGWWNMSENLQKMKNIIMIKK